MDNLTALVARELGERGGEALARALGLDQPLTGDAVQEAHETDLGNAQRLVALHGQDLRYCHPWAVWLVWDGTRWNKDSTAETVRRAKDVVRAMYAEAASEFDDDRRKALAKHALRSESGAKVKAMLELAESEPGIPVVPEEFDRSPWLLNCQNGTVDLRTGELRPHRREDLITKVVPVAFDPQATCPQWHAFLDRITAGRASLVTFLQRAVGYSLTGCTDERVLFILYGSGANGKSSFLETIALLLGDYAMRTTTDTLLARERDGIPNDVARLRSARFAYTSEAEEGRRLAEAKLKDLTGGDTIAARFLHAEWFEFRPEFKLWLASNHKPIIKGTDSAIWDRVRLVPFDVRIPEAERLPRRELMARFQAELPGIFAWAVRGCLDWQHHGLGEPEEVRAATEGYRAEMDVLAQFLGECCVVNPLAKAKAGDIYKAYATWCEENGEKPLSQRNFGMRLTERGFERRKSTGGLFWWFGIGLVDQVDDRDQFPGFSREDPLHREKPENRSTMVHLLHSDGRTDDPEAFDGDNAQSPAQLAESPLKASTETPGPPERCPVCQGSSFWQSIAHGSWTCAACHPPQAARLVARWSSPEAKATFGEVSGP